MGGRDRPGTEACDLEPGSALQGERRCSSVHIVAQSDRLPATPPAPARPAVSLPLVQVQGQAVVSRSTSASWRDGSAGSTVREGSAVDDDGQAAGEVTPDEEAVMAKRRQTFERAARKRKAARKARAAVEAKQEKPEAKPLRQVRGKAE